MISPSELALGYLWAFHSYVSATCRSRPGDADFPDDTQWNSLNTSVAGRLVAVVPSALDCYNQHCTDDQWASTTWRDEHMPGSMVQVFASLILLL